VNSNIFNDGVIIHFYIVHYHVFYFYFFVMNNLLIFINNVFIIKISNGVVIIPKGACIS
jgi:hypothetical protein